MTFEPSSAPIVRLAWERGLGLPTNSLVMGAGRKRIVHAVDTDALTFIRLWEQTILTGPDHVLAAVAAYDDAELGDHATMLRLTRDFGGRGRGTQAVYFADDLPLHQAGDAPMVSRGNPEAVLLESLCPPDDVNDAALASRPHRFTLMDVREPAGPDGRLGDDGPVACGAYAEYQGLLAHLGALVAPGFRRRGLGLLATSIAGHEALAAGLILQWRADVNNASARALASRAGFSVAGLQTTVDLRTRRK
ncbi:GNAT family N-acetyltransferase [Specibacter sp. RAF43]|uniref:GNAT family N-acetyltransferase n=1 Tax=Specibacter sp. RAF43 TaxID=3233057 RepID=UPI003F9BCAC8